MKTPESRVRILIETPRFKLSNRSEKSSILLSGSEKTFHFEIEKPEGLSPKLVVFSSNTSILKTRQHGDALVVTALRPGRAHLKILLDDYSNLFDLITGDPQYDQPIEIDVEVF